MERRKSYSMRNISDQSQVTVNNIAIGENFQTINGQRNALKSPEIKTSIAIDREVANILTWLAQEQGISPELALKKAVVTAAYIYDLTNTQKAKLLAQNKDNSISEIILK